MVSVVINYYNPTNSRRLIYQTLLCVEAYRENGSNVQIVLVDGSGNGLNGEMNKCLQQSGSHYLYFDQKKSFPEGYNAGIQYIKEKLKTEYIILSANDIIVSSQTIPKLLKVIENNSVGCVIPYLSTSDMPCQNLKYECGVCLPTGMTLNVNIFRANDLYAIGSVPEELSGYFNDMLMFLRLRKLGKNIKLINAGTIYHFGRSTTGTSTNACLQKDKATFWALYPDCIPINKNSLLRYAKFAQTKSSKSFWNIVDLITNKSILHFALLGYDKFLLLRRLLVKCHLMKYGD